MIKNDKKIVLIVDDEEDMTWSLQKNIPTENLQVIIFTASSGEEALSILEKRKIDLIVTDITMPGINGIDLLIIVRKKYPDIGVIAMTAFLTSETEAEVIESGGICLIEKPFDIIDMRDSVRNALKMDSTFFIGNRKNKTQDYSIEPYIAAKKYRELNILKNRVLT